MTGLGGFQAALAEALAAADGAACPSALTGTDRRRFRVYRNNVHHGRAEALGAAYPVVRRLVGDDFFRAMARVFLAAHPPRSRSLALMGASLPAFLDDFAPAASVPYLADVARLERAVLEALHAADAPPLDPARLTAEELALTPHPAARVVASAHPIVSLWRAHQGGGDGAVRIVKAGETALVTRPQQRVQVQALDPARGAFAEALLAGSARDQEPDRALARALALDPDLDPVAAWQPLLAGGALMPAED